MLDQLFCKHDVKRVCDYNPTLFKKKKKKTHYFDISLYFFRLSRKKGNNIFKGYISILLFKGLLLFGFFIFQFKNAYTLLCLSRDKTKRQFGNNATLTLTKTLLKKLDYSPVKF